jgi:predicted DNA-binding transcriptional regulator YafY
MNRNDRLFAILLALQQRQETAGSLADKFEVSKRTIIRDMQTLSEMGIPLYATSGPTGGYRLMDSYRLAPLQLTPQEALTLFFALKAVQGYADTPFNSARWTVLDKIQNLLPATTLSQVLPLLDHLEMEVPKRFYQVPHLEELLGHLAAETPCLEVHYRSLTASRPLQLKPLRVYAANGFWYCEAYSYRHGEKRLFRVDRMGAITPCPVPAEPLDAGGNGANQMADAGGKGNKKGPFANGSKEQPSALRASPFRLRARLSYRGMLQVERDIHIGDNIKQTSDDAWELDCTLPASEWDWAVRLFHGLGLEAEVVEPVLMREQLCRAAEQLAAVYRKVVSS